MHRYGILLITLLLATSPAYAGWTEDFLLNNNHFEINPHVVATNDTVHSVWSRLTSDSISYIRSTDGGMSWDELLAISEENHHAFHPDLSLSRNGLVVSWLDANLITGFERIGIRTSVDGSVWDTPIYVITDETRYFTRPASTVCGDSIFLVYASQRADTTGHPPIRFFYSSDYGINWSDEVTIGHSPYADPQDLLIQ